MLSLSLKHESCLCSGPCLPAGDVVRLSAPGLPPVCVSVVQLATSQAQLPYKNLPFWTKHNQFHLVKAVRDTRSETEGGSVWVFTCTELVLVKWDLLEWPGLKTLGIWERKQSAGGERNLGFLGGHQVIAGWAAVL